MTLTIRKTELVTTIDGVPVRLWKGRTPEGRPVDVFVHMIAAEGPEVQAELDRELAEVPEPAELRAIPLRLIL
jgi:hypothetical protein